MYIVYCNRYFDIFIVLNSNFTTLFTDQIKDREGR